MDRPTDCKGRALCSLSEAIWLNVTPRLVRFKCIIAQVGQGHNRMRTWVGRENRLQQPTVNYEQGKKEHVSKTIQELATSQVADSPGETSSFWLSLEVRQRRPAWRCR